MARRAVAGVLGAAALFSTSGTSQALLVPGAWAPGVAAVRLLIGAAGMVAFVTVTGREGWRPLYRHRLIWVMGVAVAGYQAFFFIGVARTGVAVGTLVSLGAAPLMAGVMGWLAREGAPGWAWGIATAIGLAGLLLLTGGGTADTLGVLAALTAGVCYATYTVIGARLARDGHDPSSVLAAGFSVGAVLSAPILLSAGWMFTPSGTVLALWLGLGATALAYLLYGLGLPVLQPGHIATLTLLEPVGATLWGVVLLGEVLTVGAWIGSGLIVLALVLVAVRDR